MQSKHRAIARLAVGTALVSMLGVSAVHPAEDIQVRAYGVGLTDLETAAAVVRPLLSPAGRVAEDCRNNRLIVVDRPDVHARVAEALRAMDLPARNVRIVVTHHGLTEEDRTGVEAAAGGRVGPVDARVGRNAPTSGVEIRGGASSSRTTSTTRQELVVLSGGEASIQVAEQVPYVEWFWTWGQPRGLWSGSVAWRDVGASMVVEPTVLGDGRMRVRLTPAFSYFLDRERLVTQVEQLATEVVVREGEEIELGAVPIADREFFDRFLIGFDKVGSRRRVRITLQAKVD